MNASLYKEDYYLWLTTTTNHLLSGRLNEIDVPNLVDELEGAAWTEKWRLLDLLEIVLLHLLKYQMLSGFRSGSVRALINARRYRLLHRLEDSPSLRAFLESTLDRQYASAKLLAIAHTGLTDNSFPIDCPYSLEQVLEVDWFPTE